MAITTLCERVHLLRRRMGITQEELAHQTGMAKNTVARLERGEIEDLAGSRVLNLAKFFDVRTDYLLGANEIEG